MRIHLAGPFLGLDPILLMFTSPGTFSFDKTLYPDHTFYDVMVIGSGGGNGGGLLGDDPDHPGTDTVVFGGAGGGGGSHRLQGLLEILGDTTDIIVGAAGADGTDGADVPADSTDGEDGEYSSFGDFIIASGGKGGLRAQTLSADENLGANGGDGGIGRQGFPAGGGGLGGTCGINDPPHVPENIGENGQNGKLFLVSGAMVGEGGGGGAGGAVAIAEPDVWLARRPFATDGGRGSYNTDELVFSPYGLHGFYTPAGSPTSFRVKPGRAGGARVTPFNRSNTTYGDSRRNGVVVIRLTAE